MYGLYLLHLVVSQCILAEVSFACRNKKGKRLWRQTFPLQESANNELTQSKMEVGMNLTYLM